MPPARALVLPIVVALGACDRDAPRSSTDMPADSLRPTRMVRVHPGQHGMAAIVRWLRSPDGSAIIAVEDWSSTENEPFFDGAVLASEHTMRMVRVDSVWDAAPSPDWNRLAYGRATRILAGEAERLPEDSIAAAARRFGVSVDAARAAQFPASGMMGAAGFARLGVVDAATGAKREFDVLAGWRVRWSQDGMRLYAGRGPTRSDDDAPPAGWLAVDPRSGTPLGSADPAAAEPPWIIGPTVDISVLPDTTRVAIPVEGGTVEGLGGMIYLRGREIGQGFVLAATRRGCFIVALAYDLDAGQYDPKHRLVVYDTGCPPPAP